MSGHSPEAAFGESTAVVCHGVCAVLWTVELVPTERVAGRLAAFNGSPPPPRRPNLLSRGGGRVDAASAGSTLSPQILYSFLALALLASACCSCVVVASSRGACSVADMNAWVKYSAGMVGLCGVVTAWVLYIESQHVHQHFPSRAYKVEGGAERRGRLSTSKAHACLSGVYF
jgi:hypothetical protein